LQLTNIIIISIALTALTVSDCKSPLKVSISVGGGCNLHEALCTIKLQLHHVWSRSTCVWNARGNTAHWHIQIA